MTRVVVVGLCLAAACRPAGTGPEGAVQVTRVAGGVQLVNATDRPVAYAVWNTGWLALFGPCADPGPRCVALPVGARAVVPDVEIGGYVPGAPEAVVRWWHVLPDGAGGYRAGPIHEITVRL